MRMLNNNARRSASGTNTDRVQEDVMRKYTVKYKVATYSGEVTVYVDENADQDHIIAKAKQQLTRNGPLPFGYESWRII
jgi:hypothetical protein